MDAPLDLTLASNATFAFLLSAVKNTGVRTLRCLALPACSVLLCCSRVEAQFVPPTPAELSMTSVPDAPGAPAVYLLREEITDDSLRMFSFYTRLKVLNERGKEYANVELPFYAGQAGFRIDSISGRTIHPDGSVIPFSGKPYEKLIEKQGRGAYKAKVFTLPSVETGSILEYRYKIHYEDAYYMHPDWYVQNELYLVKGHFLWKPTSNLVVTNDERGQVSSSIAWTPILPKGAEVKSGQQYGSTHGSSETTHNEVELNIQDVPPTSSEEFLPPMGGLAYRVLFYYTPYRSSDEYWKNEGKHWSTVVDRFTRPGKVVEAQTRELVADSDPQLVKLKKIYAYIMTLDNTDFSRQHSQAEDKAEGLKSAATADDVVARKRGSGDQLAEVFVSMARAAGMQAYVCGVSSREQRLFMKEYLNTRQFDDLIAIVNVDGKEMMFDPGQRYETFGHLAWQHTVAGGLRQAEGGAKLLVTPAEPYSWERVTRIGNLTFDDHGVAEGEVKFTYTGDEATVWRQRALTGDAESMKNDLRQEIASNLPGGVEVKIDKVEDMTDGEKPLTVTAAIKGPIATSTGKRLLVPADLFTVNDKAIFHEAKRTLPVVMHHASQVQDAVRYKYPPVLGVESTPPPEKAAVEGAVAFNTVVKPASGSVTLYHNLTQGHVTYGPGEYPQLREFYEKVSSHNGDMVIFTRADAGAAAKSSGGTN